MFLSFMSRDVYSSDEGPFLYITQFRLATRLVIMSMDTFNILAQSLPQSEAKLIIVANTGPRSLKKGEEVNFVLIVPHTT